MATQKSILIDNLVGDIRSL